MLKNLKTVDIINKIYEIGETKVGIDKMFYYFLDNMYLRVKNSNTGKVSGILFADIGENNIVLNLTDSINTKTLKSYLVYLWVDIQSEDEDDIPNDLLESKFNSVINMDIMISERDRKSNSVTEFHVKDIETSEDAITLIY